MPTMTKRERVDAAIHGLPVDRVPVTFWRHAPEVDHTAKGLAEATLDFHRRWDLDLIKIMSSGVYCVEDWGCPRHGGGRRRDRLTWTPRADQWLLFHAATVK